MQIDPTIAGPAYEGFQLRFIKVSAKTFERSGAKVSQLGDYLRSCGFKGTIRTTQDQADAAEATAGSTYPVILDWKVYNSATQFSLEGMTKFPRNDDGTYQSWIEDPGDLVESQTEKNQDGSPKRVPKRLRANLFISRFLPAAA